mmetsp:Transcript_6740/g.16347  ORF Transcript_6740/g.16347 Transcript_6740/m.16347 type:complete len:178 (-) Transcript_6740:2181-2714(-)
MNAGAARASGAVLWFVHADTVVPEDGVAVIAAALRDSRVVAGGFVSLMAGAETTRWATSLHNAVKTYYGPLLFRPLKCFRGLRILFGDQAIFVRRTAFVACGGYNEEHTVLEDASLCDRLAPTYGRIVQVSRTVRSSDRRVARWGELRANVIYLVIGVLCGLGVAPGVMRRIYPDVR